MCSNNFEAMHVREMGLNIHAIYLQPFVYTGTASVHLQSSRTTPVSRAKLNMNARMRAISWCSSLRILAEISSGTEALFGESPCSRSFSTPPPGSSSGRSLEKRP